MKIIKTIVLTVGSLGLVLGMGIFIFLQVFDTDVYKAQLTQQVSKIIGRPLNLGHFSLGVSLEGPTLDVGPIVVPDTIDFTSQPLATIDRVRVGLDVPSLIFLHKVQITRILLQSPQIHIIRSQEGRLNIYSVKDPGGPEVSGKSPAVPSVIKAQPYRQKAVARDWEVSIKSIDIRDGAISLIDQDEHFPLDIWVSNINASIDDFSLTKKPFTIVLTASALSAEDNLHLKANISFNNSGLKAGDVTFHTDLAQLSAEGVKNISPLLAKMSLPAPWQGDIVIHLDDLTIGASGPLKASGDVHLDNVSIGNFDLGQMIFSRTLGAYGDIFKLPVNLLEGPLNGQCAFSFEGQDFLISKASIGTKDFDFTAQGAIQGDLNTNFETVFSLSEDTSLNLAQQIKMIGFLLDDQKRLVIPAAVSGKWPDLEYKLPKDFRKKIKKAFRKEGAGQVINDVLRSFLR